MIEIFEKWYNNHLSDIRGRFKLLPDLKRRYVEIEKRLSNSTDNMFMTDAHRLLIMREIAKRLGKEGRQ